MSTSIKSIIHAIENSDLSALDYLISEGNVNQKIGYDDNDTLLMYSFSFSSLEVCYYLLKKGADISDTNGIGESVLHSAVYSNEASKIEFLVTECGVNINSQTFDGTSALLLATGLEKDEVFLKLIELGADVNLPDYECSTPLHVASSLGRLDFVMKLIDNGGNCFLKTKKGNYPLALAVNNDNIDVIKYIFHHSFAGENHVVSNPSS